MRMITKQKAWFAPLVLALLGGCPTTSESGMDMLALPSDDGLGPQRLTIRVTNIPQGASHITYWLREPGPQANVLRQGDLTARQVAQPDSMGTMTLLVPGLPDRPLILDVDLYQENGSCGRWPIFSQEAMDVSELTRSVDVNAQNQTTCTIKPRPLRVQRAGTGTGAMTVTLGGTGNTCDQGLCEYSVLYQNTIEVRPTPSAGSYFSDWGLACQDAKHSDPCQVRAVDKLSYYDKRIQIDATFSEATRFGSYYKDKVPVATNLYGIYGLAPDDVYAVGEGGVVLHWDGKLWTSEKSDANGVNLNGVWAADANDVWAVGDQGVVIRRRNGTWSQVQSTAGTNKLVAIHGIDSNSLWIVGNDCAYQRTGTGFEPCRMLPSGPSLTGVAVRGGKEAYVVGSLFGAAYVAVWNGSEFASENAGGGTGLLGVWATPSAVAMPKAFAVGTGGIGRVRNVAVPWAALATGTTKDISAIWGTGSAGNNLWLVGKGSLISRSGNGGMSFTPDALGALPATDFTAVWGTDSANVWVVGKAGTVLRYVP